MLWYGHSMDKVWYGYSIACFVHAKKAKQGEQKIATKNFAVFHNNSPMLIIKFCNSSTCAIVTISCVST